MAAIYCLLSQLPSTCSCGYHEDKWLKYMFNLKN
ncbi:unnamed protein product [Larinioides sclopetarius]|uniref:Uncharacterized protein n=1 Tax=Larinioides sclopetarius TaxID=280406 RepID=A0AAV2ANE3_9ARAC